MDRNCDAFIRSNNTYDILIARESLEISDDRAECIQNIGEKFVAEYFDRDEVPQLSIETYGYSVIPKCFGLLDTLALETTGILQLQNQPALSLRGQGIFIGFVDTGISYELPCFRNSDGSTRIRSIWDQSIPAGEENTPQGFLYGTEYTQKEINEALEQEHPRELVPVTDEDGHGTMLASIACGSEDLQAGFTGAAPYAELLVVKLKPAKPYLKDFFYIPQEMPAYQENDIMAAVEYLEETARKLGRPLILCLGLGTNNGSHSGGSNLSELLDDIAGRWRRCAVVATGNEANARHHFYGKSDGNSMVAVEVNVEQRMRGFYLELWASAPELFVVAVRSPGGTLMPAQNVPGNSHQEQEFIFEGTRVEIDYAQVGRTRGDQLVFIRFENPAAGIWTLYVNPSTTITGQFHIWLPMSGMLEKDVVFLRPDPDVTLTDWGGWDGSKKRDFVSGFRKGIYDYFGGKTGFCGTGSGGTGGRKAWKLCDTDGNECSFCNCGRSMCTDHGVGKQPWEKTAFKFGADRKYSDPRVRKEPGCILSEYRLGLWKNECLRCTDEILWGIKFIYKA